MPRLILPPQLMTTPDPLTAITVADAKRHIAAKVFGDCLGGSELGKIGLEPEFLVLRVDEDGAPIDRLPLEGETSVLSALEPLLASGELEVTTVGPPPVYTLRNGGRITFEPGAQVEHSTAIHESAAAAMVDVEQTADLLGDALAPLGAVLAPVGLDVFTEREGVRQQLRAARYDSMGAYFDLRSPHGRVMMRHTGSFQVNLDLGPRDVATERWRLINLLSPIATASFADSPEGGAVSRRAQAWQGLDPSRTGFARELFENDAVDPGEAYAEFALDADLLLFRKPEGGAGLGEPGFSLRRWLQEGHPVHGLPTIDDIDYHLTTLFPEVRLRGFFEIRSCDALPRRWRGVNVVFWAGLVYDAQARRAALELLEPTRASLQEAWEEAAVLGLASSHVRELAGPIWRLALEGARRLPSGWFREADLEVTERYIEHFVDQGRSPAQELAEALQGGAGAALEWARRES
jgi:glutamate--cysteine ligase